MKKRKLIFERESYAITGAAIEVHRQLGPGYLEAVYHEALILELSERGIPFESEKMIPIFYKGRALKQYYKADFICFNKIIVEIKAIKELTGRELAQTQNYLKATRIQLGLLYNFGSFGRLERERFILNEDKFVPAVIESPTERKNYWVS